MFLFSCTLRSYVAVLLVVDVGTGGGGTVKSTYKSCYLDSTKIKNLLYNRLPAVSTDKGHTYDR